MANAKNEAVNWDVHPALATVSSELFAVCGVATDDIMDVGGAADMNSRS